MKTFFKFLAVCLFLVVFIQTLQSKESWEAWKSYKTIIIKDIAGLARQNDPVEIPLSFHKNEILHLKQEIRVVKFLDNQAYKEIPCQVFEIKLSFKLNLIS